MLKCGSSTHSGRPRSIGTNCTFCRYRGTCGSFDATMATMSSYGGGGPSKIATDAMCMWLMSSSKCRNDASCGLMRSIRPPSLGELRNSVLQPIPDAAAGCTSRSAVSGCVAEDPKPCRQSGVGEAPAHRLADVAGDARPAREVHGLHAHHRLVLAGRLEGQHRRTGPAHLAGLRGQIA